MRSSHEGKSIRADLEQWYVKCLRPEFAKPLGEDLLKNLGREFDSEFPSTGKALVNFQAKRGYDKIGLQGIWNLPKM